MKGKFLSGLIVIVLLNLLVKPFYLLGIDAEVQNRVGEEVYGNYFSLLNFAFLFNILLDLGITNYNTRNIAQHPQLLQKHFFRILTLRFGLFILYAAFTFLAGLFLGYGAYEFYLLSILVINQFLVAIIQFSRSNFGGLHLFKTDAIVSVLDRTLLIVFCAVLLWTDLMGGPFQIEWFVYAQTLAYGITAITALFILSGKVGQVKVGIQRSFSLAILKQSAPYALLIFLMMMYNRIDAVMIERFAENGNIQAGIYAQGFRFLDAVNMFALLFAGILLPVFSRLIKQKGDVQEMLQLGYRLLGGVSIVVGISCFFYKEFLIDLRYPDAHASSAVIFGFLILSFIPISLTYIFGTLLTANGSLKQLNYMALFGVLVNVVLNFVLIKHYQAVGAAVATLITQSVTAVIQIVLVYRVFTFKPVIKELFRLIVFGGFLCGIFFLWNYLSLEISAGKGLLILLTISVISGFLFGLFRLSDFKEIRPKNN